MAGQPLALNPGAYQYTGPACDTKKYFIGAAVAGDITTTVIKGRQAGPMSSLLILDVYEPCPCAIYFFKLEQMLIIEIM